MVTMHSEEPYLISEVSIEQWLLAALRLQRGLSLKPCGRSLLRARNRCAETQGRSRSSLWVMLGASLLGFVLL